MLDININKKRKIIFRKNLLEKCNLNKNIGIKKLK
jgi:hypothetical protein